MRSVGRSGAASSATSGAAGFIKPPRRTIEKARNLSADDAAPIRHMRGCYLTAATSFSQSASVAICFSVSRSAGRLTGFWNCG